MNALLHLLSDFVARLLRTLDGPLCIALAALRRQPSRQPNPLLNRRPKPRLNNRPQPNSQRRQPCGW